jgi:2-phosphosulfolactate phosphatase
VTAPGERRDVELEWGLHGVESLAGRCDHLVLLDVLSFTTCVDLALARGAEVLPWRWRDETAATFARSRGARLAVRREGAGPDDLGLSPATMGRLEAGEAVVLPSPNGATLSVAARGHGSVWAACLRNASATARHLARLGGTVGLVPAGERWPDGSLRLAFEDHVAAGALAARLRGVTTPEVAAARGAFEAVRGRLPRLLGESVSGRELLGRGHHDDVALAAELDASDTLCRLQGDGYVREPA